MSEKRRSKLARTFAFNVTTKVQRLIKANPTRCGLLIYNNGSVTVYLLSAGNLAVADGIPIIAGAQYDNSHTTAEYWIATSSGSCNVRVEEDTG